MISTTSDLDGLLSWLGLLVHILWLFSCFSWTLDTLALRYLGYSALTWVYLVEEIGHGLEVCD